MKPYPEHGATPVETWLDALNGWYAGIASNSHYQERVYCYFTPGEGGPCLNFAVALAPTPEQALNAAGQKPPPAVIPPANGGEENRTKRVSKPLVNDRPAIAALLPTRAEARGRVVVRPRQDATEKSAETETLPSSDKTARLALKVNVASDFKSAWVSSFDLDNRLKLASRSALNQDLFQLLELSPPPAHAPGKAAPIVTLPTETLQGDPCFQTVDARQGILLRAALIAKVTGSKANLALYINRLEDLRALFPQIDELPLRIQQRGRLLRLLWELLDEVKESAPVIPERLKSLPTTLRDRLTGPAPNPPGNLLDALWYFWNLALPAWSSQHAAAITRCGHLLSFSAFASLLLLCVHPSLAFGSGILEHVFAALSAWRTHYLPDIASLTLALAMGAGAAYALATRQLTLADRVALAINDKIETVLDSSLADLMKANMDVQIGRLGKGEQPAFVPESVARKLDAVFALKEMVNSYESTVRARRRHVADEVSKAQNIRLESHHRLRNAALGVTASFVLLEIGSRIQDHRNLQAGTDPLSFAYWLENAKSAEAGAAVEQTSHAAITTLDCARKEVQLQQPASFECLDEWRDSALASSSQLLFLVFLIAMLVFAARVIRRDDKSDEA